MNKKIIIFNIRGKFGNQLHQYGTGLALAKKLNAKFKVDLSFFDQEKYKSWYKLDNININIERATEKEIAQLKNQDNAPIIYRALKKFGIPSRYRKNTDIKETFGFKPDQRIIELDNSAYITGWCCIEKYIHDIQTTLREKFVPKVPLTSFAGEYIKKVQNSNSVSLHIRRGDYMNYNNFYRIIPIDYYKKAIKLITKRIENPEFFIFSNDIQWVKDNFKFIENPNFMDLSSSENYNGLADIEEFEIMKHCQNNIIGNSSFSWWAAYLNANSNKIVMAPEKWYKDKFYQDSFEKYPIFPEEWISL